MTIVFETEKQTIKMLRLSALLVLLAFVSICKGITGGKESVPHSRPYMASIQRNGKHECGGFLVAEQWVMSAAHCFLQGTDGVKIVLGAHSLTKPEESKQEFSIDTVYKHAAFSLANYDSDIALVKMTSKANMNDAVSALEFQRTGEALPQPGDVVTSAGWGSLNNLGLRPDTLQEVDVEVIVSNLCSRGDYYGLKFTSNMICAAKKRKDTCDGDSGGPLLYQNVAVGVTSNGGKKCGTLKKPGLYTIISNFTDWIEKTMRE
ncbi:complement factor D-like [Paramormyrops kingsleyae]|uniref:trypsin n=1 Tax=Paramormyrops kingsleyae TaxID=1676925 RepID=A0A3B3QVC6_9TELE|nr:complement factor D-like [Paramormyrops kingsleyae]